MEIKIPVGERNIHFLLYPSINLIAHTANLSGLYLGGIGSKNYHLLNDANALSGIDKNSPMNRAQFTMLTYNMGLNHVEKTEDALNVIKILNTEYGGEIYPYALLNNSWNEFYKEYWNKNKERLESDFLDVVNGRDWAGTLSKMKYAVGTELPIDFFAVATEATAGSATFISPNMSIGTPRKGSDCGFVHEGLHMLIAAAPDKYARVIEFMNSHEWTPELKRKFPYSDWRGKIEQAVVITLDSEITGRKEYLDGCVVGELRSTVYENIKTWYRDGSQKPLPDFLMEILKDNEKEIFE